MQIDVDAKQIDVDAKQVDGKQSDGYSRSGYSSEGNPRDGCSRDAFQTQVISIPTKVWLICLKITFCYSAGSSFRQARR